ncbi:MAG: TetR/AcrR family transcriptional regulator [Spirochaetia bacterium]|nr:TetR/AcrR family transcriptional regulator [Spirochaetia bacterium]
MSSKTRRERDAEIMKTKILAAAREIAQKEGYSQISIRKIAQKIEYTPSIMYHYFANKEEIVSKLLEQGSSELNKDLADKHQGSQDPVEALKQMTRRYIEIALAKPEEFVAVHLDDSEHVTEHTSFLFKGSCEKRLALNILKQTIIEFSGKKFTDEDELELTAQSIAAATMGLALKLIAEKQLEAAQRQRVIDYFCNVVVLRMAKAL